MIARFSSHSTSEVANTLAEVLRTLASSDELLQSVAEEVASTE